MYVYSGANGSRLTVVDGTTTGEVDSDVCVHLGGLGGIDELNLGFLARVLVDQRINGYFLNSDVDAANLVSCLNDQIGDAVSCAGVTYGCKDMLSAHAGMGISTLDFDDLVEDYSLALDDHQAAHPDVTDTDKATILGALAAMSADIIEDPTNDQTIYQRVGRKPAIKAMVGLIGEVDTFIDTVAKDFEINGFFLASDFDRLNTCFTRQLGDLDGPIDYGLEVDPPAADVDPGVGLGDPCKAMQEGHAGLTDPNQGDSPITYIDFVALVSDLSSAMTAAGWSVSDHDAVIAAMEPLCVEIVADPNECPGNAQTILTKKTALALDIPDDTYDGTLGSMACVDLNVIDDGINFVWQVAEVKVAIEHGEVGDLVIKVRSPDGAITTLMSRPGFAEGADDGAGNGGDKSSMKKVFPVGFRDAGLVDAEMMGIGNVVCQDDGLCDYFPNPGSGPGTNLADFFGITSVGVWTVCFGDAEPGGMGYVDAVSLEIDKVKFDPN